MIELPAERVRETLVCWYARSHPKEKDSGINGARGKFDLGRLLTSYENKVKLAKLGVVPVSASEQTTHLSFGCKKVFRAPCCEQTAFESTHQLLWDAGYQPKPAQKPNAPPLKPNDPPLKPNDPPDMRTSFVALLRQDDWQGLKKLIEKNWVGSERISSISRN